MGTANSWDRKTFPVASSKTSGPTYKARDTGPDEPLGKLKEADTKKANGPKSSADRKGLHQLTKARPSKPEPT